MRRARVWIEDALRVKPPTVIGSLVYVGRRKRRARADKQYCCLRLLVEEHL
jgi:hypothetical protein